MEHLNYKEFGSLRQYLEMTSTYYMTENVKWLGYKPEMSYFLGEHLNHYTTTSLPVVFALLLGG